ncbi:hypothetical protein [Legionella cincinnatiensis]|uniref:Uncharacterized protein n=1 Tax=Legionella cincinnatiensis TaxID=28085 RepID=A0A378IHD1_9GAMM|nr:hypothetical protein [Legionella cincinnatiensis]KTC81879.1 hypothetical protein Lcin_2949 [Legionella cincinnatiensis]STX34658.1 Uncharacterised protein [Legionella cincinnatiensis]
MSCLDTLKYIIQEIIKEKNKLHQENTVYLERTCCTLYEKKVVIDSLIKNLAFEIAVRDEIFTKRLQIPEVGIQPYSETTCKNLINITVAMDTLNKASNSGIKFSEKGLEDILFKFGKKAESYLSHPFIKQYIVHDGKFQLFMGRTINTINKVFLQKYIFL